VIYRNITFHYVIGIALTIKGTLSLHKIVESNIIPAINSFIDKLRGRKNIAFCTLFRIA
jgi:hypothetical protein